MATATQQEDHQVITIVETLSGDSRVDRENGVIRNVKLIGFHSKNGRRYPPGVLKAAVHLYENAKVNIDHPDGSPVKVRKYGDRLGVIRSARFLESSGIYGDFHFNPKHPAAEQICWDAENNPEALGFSHNALLRVGPVKQGQQVIEEIVNIRSMDLVADPATTTSLFESELPMDPAAPADPTITSPGEAIKSAFKQMIVAAVDDTSLDMKATMTKIKEIMKAQEKLMGGSGEDSPEQTPTEESVQLKQQVGLLQQQIEQFQAKEKEAQLVESIDAALTKVGLDAKNPAHVSELFSKQLLATEDEKQRDEMIADRAALVKPSKTHARPRYGSQPRTSQMQTALESIDSAEFANRLLS